MASRDEGFLVLRRFLVTLSRALALFLEDSMRTVLASLMGSLGVGGAAVVSEELESILLVSEDSLRLV